MAASRTAPGRTPHSVHVYYIRAGDARRPVDFHVVRSRDGGTLSTRQVTATQDGEVLLEALASFSTPVDGGVDYHGRRCRTSRLPRRCSPSREQLADFADELDGYWVREQPFELRYVDAPPRLARRPSRAVTPHPVVVAAKRTRGRRRRERRDPAQLPADVPVRHHDAGDRPHHAAATPATAFNALIDHALWFHRPVDLTDWVLSDQFSPSGIGGRGLATATMYNRTGQRGVHRDPGAVLRSAPGRLAFVGDDGPAVPPLNPRHDDVEQLERPRHRLVHDVLRANAAACRTRAPAA